MGKSPAARCWESACSRLRSASGCVMARGKHNKKMWLSHEPGARWGCQDDMSLTRDLCATLSCDLMGWLRSCHRVCVKESYWMSPTSRLPLVTVVQTQPLEAGEGSDYVTGVIAYWSHFGTGGRSSKELFTVPWAAKEAIHCRAAGAVPWLMGGRGCRDSNGLGCGMHLPGQQCPRLQDLPCHPHAALGSCSSDSPSDKNNRYLAAVKVVVIIQPHSSKQGRPVHRPGTALVMSLSGRYCSLTDVISSLSGTARLSPFPCTLGWMLFCYQIVQTSPAPCSLSISMIWLHLAGVLWLSILWCNSGQ